MSGGRPGLLGGGRWNSFPGCTRVESEGGPSNMPGGCCSSPGGLMRGKLPGGSLPPGGKVPTGGLGGGLPISLTCGTPVGRCTSLNGGRMPGNLEISFGGGLDGI